MISLDWELCAHILGGIFSPKNIFCGEKNIFRKISSSQLRFRIITERSVIIRNLSWDDDIFMKNIFFIIKKFFFGGIFIFS